ncbi:MAG: ferritin-like domain-containing protein, partial [Ilumatobacteraceae bacterium]|nr:ferritin-like domain-containing protein [Ilumatobacteraceae bacterium]
MSITENESKDILGRSDLNDIEGILSITNDDVDAIQHIVKDNADAIFTWDYSLTRPALRKLYEKAKVGQW